MVVDGRGFQRVAVTGLVPGRHPEGVIGAGGQAVNSLVAIRRDSLGLRQHRPRRSAVGGTLDDVVEQSSLLVRHGGVVGLAALDLQVRGSTVLGDAETRDRVRSLAEHHDASVGGAFGGGQEHTAVGVEVDAANSIQARERAGGVARPVDRDLSAVRVDFYDGTARPQEARGLAPREHTLGLRLHLGTVEDIAHSRLRKIGRGELLNHVVVGVALFQTAEPDQREVDRAVHRVGADAVGVAELPVGQVEKDRAVEGTVGVIDLDAVVDLAVDEHFASLVDVDARAVVVHAGQVLLRVEVGGAAAGEARAGQLGE